MANKGRPFPKGTSGNPRGRPPVSETHKAILERIGTEVIKGTMTAKEALDRVLYSKGLHGDVRAIEVIHNREEGNPAQTVINQNEGPGLNIHFVTGAVDEGKLDIEVRSERVEPTGDPKP